MIGQVDDIVDPFIPATSPRFDTSKSMSLILSGEMVYNGGSWLEDVDGVRGPGLPARLVSPWPVLGNFTASLLMVLLSIELSL